MIEFHPSMLVAQNVLNCLLMDAQANELDIYVKAFNNCREQGYALSLHEARHMYWVAQNRNSDHIVVYSGQADFNDMPDDDAWGSAQYFRYNEFHEAAEWIKKDALPRHRLGVAKIDSIRKKMDEATQKHIFALVDLAKEQKADPQDVLSDIDALFTAEEMEDVKEEGLAVKIAYLLSHGRTFDDLSRIIKDEAQA